MNTELLRQRLKELEKTTTPRYYTQYDYAGVERCLNRFFTSQGIDRNYSAKRKGYVVRCPGGATHSQRNRWDDCVIYTTRKSNGFSFISARCRHDSCQDAIIEHCKYLNREWGLYLNQNYV